MTSRLRERRRSSSREPGILRGPGVPSTGTGGFAPVEHGARRRGVVGWRAISAMIVLALSAVLFMFFAVPIFYVHSIAVGGLKYLTKEEVFALTDVANMHVFWINPETVRQSILRSPTIADARVTISWPPNMVQIVVQEREPALVWEQTGVATWVDVQGRVMYQHEERPDLVKIASLISDGPMGQNVQLNLDIVTGALQLKQLRPNIDVLRYDPVKGLGYPDGRGWMVWFGIGTDMPEKLLIYETIVSDLQARGIVPTTVDVGNPDAPVYCCKGN
ncbi:MAG: FtsQ-type POTRA domain-containing protein [Anaerolineae bacterium]|nr:FtsQ-type POTRA domain-containing protein [Anaerolineae bacterium]